MNLQKDQLVISMSKCLFELMGLASEKWEEVYFWFSKPNNSHTQSQCTFKNEKELSFVIHEKDDDYFEVLEGLMETLFEEIGKNKQHGPKVCVLRVNAEGEFNVDFDYEDPEAMNVSILALGYEHSFFPEGEIDIADDVSDFQNELARQ